MHLMKIIPKSLIRYTRIKINNKRYPSSQIFTDRISKNVKIEGFCKVSENVTIAENTNIGRYSYINRDSIIGSNVKIGRYCSISYSTKIGMAEHPIDFITTSPYLYGHNNIFGEPGGWDDYKQGVIIGNDVWIGANAVIMQGVRIGDGSIIGAGAIVTKDVEPYSIVGGVPAKHIKKRFNDEKINQLLKLKWWEWDEEKIKECRDLFLSKDRWHELL